ncbi:hypothetical protein DM01DRAFT_1318052 [Hesseltinella vesiculosa]|uniref:Transmembrane 9 superfamily member n=1 Tax=Hesseltinella vesiculosa TaxID=101127 RepID=A0A1X2GPJ9_9FUNG|nr:hypothetical protein DM01DRAFT_1318052 [Hesseltinella vesiculosa]
MASDVFAVLIICSLLLFGAHGATFEKDALIPLMNAKVFSHRTQLTHAYGSLPFLCPSQHHSVEHSWLAIDQDLLGDRPVKSDIQIRALENVDCATVCSKAWTVSDAMEAKALIEDDYQVEWWLDNVPCVTASYTNEISTRVYRTGFPLGRIVNGQIYINNHVTLNVVYSREEHDPNKIRLVGFEVYPESIQNGECQRKTMDTLMQHVTERRTTVRFTYAVKWKEVPPPERPWSMFVMAPNPDTYLASSINMAIMLVLLSLVVLVILFKTTRKEPASFDELHDELDEVIGWRLVHRDVFRRPMYGGLLAPLLGTGVQLLLVFSYLMLAISKDWVHLANPASIIRLLIKSFVYTSVIAGYWSARIYKVFRGRSWFFNACLTGVLVPGVILGCLLGQTMVAWCVDSSLAVSFRGWTVVMFLWWLVVVPLTLIGGWLGERQGVIEHPVRTTQMPRLIPRKRWYQEYHISLLLGGVIPFTVMFVDLHDLYKSILEKEISIMMSHLVTSSAVMALVIAQVTVILVFFQLCNEDYHWWWMSFLLGGSSSVYIFLYGLIYYMTKSEVSGFYGGLIYLIRLALGCSLLCLATGALGFFSAYGMARRIYSAVKVD